MISPELSGRRHRGVRWMAVLALPLLVLLASCSSDESLQVASLDGESVGPSQSASRSVEDDGLAFARCMRDQGVDVPDPDPDARFGSGGQNPGNVDLDDPKFQKALRECQDLLPGGSPSDRTFDAKAQELILKLAKCMRQEGVEFPDPQFDANGQPVGGGNIRAKILSDPKFREALRKCRKFVPGR